MHKKIESLGKVSGTVSFMASDQEIRAINGWMGTSLKGPILRLRLRDFEKRYKDSKFEDIPLWEAIEWITGKPIVPKVEQMEKAKTSWEQFYQGLKEKYFSVHAQVLLAHIEGKQKGTTGFVSAYNAGNLESIEFIVKAVDELPEKHIERLPVFSKRVTGNPHYFDKEKKLVQALEILLSKQEDRLCKRIVGNEEEATILYSFGIARDDLHSFVTIYGFEATRENKELKQWYYANEERSIQNVPIRCLVSIDTIKPTHGTIAYVVENSGVFSSLIDELEEVVPLVCTHGNIKLSGFLFLDKLVAAGYTIMYSGDADINGILIAQRLKNRYGDALSFWYMDKQAYQASQSSVTVEEKELVRLNKPLVDELEQVAECIREERRVGYQEALVPEYLKTLTGIQSNKH